MPTGIKTVEICRECRGYNLERKWCGNCNGSGFEPEKPVPLYSGIERLKDIATTQQQE